MRILFGFAQENTTSAVDNSSQSACGGGGRDWRVCVCVRETALGERGSRYYHPHPRDEENRGEEVKQVA